MGADMLIASLVLPEGGNPDFATAHRAVETVTAADVEEPDEFSDLDPGSGSALREDLHRCLDELERELRGREFTWVNVRGVDMYLTGGLSWGEPPTQAFEIVERLRGVRGVLAAAGFEGGAAMSAFVVSPIHIDVMLSVALNGPRDAERSRADWLPPYLELSAAPLSAITCSPLGAALLAECIASVRYRYPDDDLDQLPGPVPGPVPIPRPDQYEFTDLGPCVSIVEACKAIDCYEYQSCEHPGWAESIACSFCGRLRQILTANLPGATEAPWEWTPETLAARGLIPVVALPSRC